MRWFHDLKLSGKLLTGFSLLSIVAATIGFIGITKIRELDDADTRLYEEMTVPIGQIGDVRTAIQRIRYNLLSAATTTEDSTRAYNLETARRLGNEIDSLLSENKKLATSEDHQRSLAAIVTARENWLVVRDQLAQLLESGRNAEAQQLLATEGRVRLLALDQALDFMHVHNFAEAKGTADANTVLANRATLVMLIALGIGGVLAIAIALFISRRISRQVALIATRTKELEEVAVAGLGRAATAMAGGDLTGDVSKEVHKIAFDSKDEFGQLARAVDGIIERTSATVAAFAQARETLKQVVGESDALIRAAKEGRLEVRGSAERYAGVFRDLVSGLNETLDAVVTPINEAAGVLTRVADRDLSARMTGDYRGDFSRIKDSINTAVTNLDDALSQVNASSMQVTAAASQITAGSQSLAEGSSEQASSLEEVSSSLTELASMAHQSAENAREASDIATQAQAAVEQGTHGMTRLSSAIGQIKSSSDQTAKIVKTIDEIAFQTNLLALNAAVEAARAGDAGRGFAVVAEEVRNLAMRAAEAAKQTAALIEDSGRYADAGVAANAEVVVVLSDMQRRVSRVGEVVNEIAAASAQQRDGVSQINTAVEQMNGVTQAVAANAEEAAAAAEELTGQAATLGNMVRQFTITRATRLNSAAQTNAPLSERSSSLAPRTQRPKQPSPRAFTARPVITPAMQAIPFGEDEEAVALAEF